MHNGRMVSCYNVISLMVFMWFNTNVTRGPFHKKILRLRYTLRTSSSSWRNTTSVIVSQQTVVTTTSSHSQSLVMFENTRNHKIMVFVKRIFSPDICLRLRSLLRFFVKRGPGPHTTGPQKTIEQCLFGIFLIYFHIIYNT